MIPREILKKIRQIEIRTNRLVSETLAGQYHSVFKGQGMNFDEVREYQPGDEVRTIDWNVTARMNHPFVKKFVEERELTLMLLVDASASGLFGSHAQSKRELAAEIASVLAFSAIRNNDKVGLILFTDEVEKFIPPRKGRRHVLRVIREGDDGDLGHGRFGEGVEQLRAVHDDATVLLLRAGEEAGDVFERDQRNVEAVAEAHEARALDAGVDVEHSGKKVWLVGDDADGLAVEAGE